MLEIYDQSGRVDTAARWRTATPRTSLCPTPEKYYYWDDINPTHAGWKAVVKTYECLLAVTADHYRFSIN
jgi:phospholipase/lecithinase/hemolysin